MLDLYWIGLVEFNICIEPVKPKLVKGSAAALLAVLATMEAIDEKFPDVDQGLLPLEDIIL